MKIILHTSGILRKHRRCREHVERGRESVVCTDHNTSLISTPSFCSTLSDCLITNERLAHKGEKTTRTHLLAPELDQPNQNHMSFFLKTVQNAAISLIKSARTMHHEIEVQWRV